MREHVVQKLRQCTCVKGKQATWVSKLTDDQLYDLFLKLRTDEPARSIARQIQKQWGVDPGSSAHSTSQGILKFKRRIAHLLLAPPLESPNTSFSTDPEKISQLDGIEDIDRIARLQLKRIHRMIEEEVETGVKHGSMSREIHALTALTKALLKAKEWDLVHAGVDPIRRQKLERVKQRFCSVLDNLIGDGGERLLEASQKFLELAEEAAVDVTVGPDGKVTLEKPQGALGKLDPKITVAQGAGCGSAEQEQ